MNAVKTSAPQFPLTGPEAQLADSMMVGLSANLLKRLRNERDQLKARLDELDRDIAALERMHLRFSPDPKPARRGQYREHPETPCPECGAIGDHAHLS